MVADLRRWRGEHEDGPDPLLFHLASAAEGEKFFAQRWPTARAIADPGKVFYEAFGRRRGKARDFIGWGALRAALKQVWRHGAGKPIGDPFTMPGVFLVRGTTIIREHEFAHAGDNPNFSKFA